MEAQELSLQASVETIVFHKFILRIVHRRETLLPVLPEHLLPIGVRSLFMADERERSHWKQCTVLSCVTGSLYMLSSTTPRWWKQQEETEITTPRSGSAESENVRNVFDGFYCIRVQMHPKQNLTIGPI